MSSAQKKVIIRRLTGDTLAGYLPLAGFVRSSNSSPANHVADLLDLSGRVASVPIPEIKYICYVKDFNLNDAFNPERLTRRTFLARPRTEGLWVRLTFRGTGSSHATVEPEILEGLAPIDLTLADGLIDDTGLFLVPPDIRSNTQRIFVPRSAIADLQLLAVITTPSRRKPAPSGSPSSLQDDLFQSLSPSSRPN